MSECTRKDLAELLHAYELGLLPEDKRTEVELHLLECEHCFHTAEKTLEASRLLKFHSATRQEVRSLKPEPSAVSAPAPRARLVWRWAVPSLVAVTVLVFLVLKDWRFDIRPEESVVASENRIAILPFQNLIQPADSGRYGNILSGLLVTYLSESPQLSVVSSQYIADLTARQQSEIEVARKANARWLVTGAISQVTPNLQMSAELVEVGTGSVRVAVREEGAGDRSLFATAERLAGKLKQALLEPAAISHERDRAIAEITTESPEAYQEYIRGLDLWQRMYVDDAEPHFRKAIALDSTFAMPYYYLSTLASGAERAELNRKALKYVDRAGTRDSYLIRSRAAFFEGNQEEGIRILGEFVTRFPDEKQPLLYLARVEHALRQYAAALTHTHAAIALDSAYEEAYNQLAFTYNQLGDFENAIRAIDRYVALAPNDANPYDSRAQLYALNGRLDQAIESYRQALAIKPDFFSSLTYLGIMYVFDRDYVRAERCFVAYANIPVPSSQASSRLYLSYIPGHQGRFDEALALLRKYQLQDSLEQSTFGLSSKRHLEAIYLEASGRLPEAIATMERSIAGASVPESGDSYRKKTYLICLLIKNGETEKARRLTSSLKHLLDSSGASLAPYWVVQGALADAMGMTDSALFWYGQVVDRSEQFYDRLAAGLAYLKANRLADAVASFEYLLAHYTSPRMFWNPESVKLHYYLGLAYERSNWNDRALREYEIFLDIWKNADAGLVERTDAEQRIQRLRANL